MLNTDLHKDGSVSFKLYCHRIGCFTLKGAKIRNIKVLGSNKINGHCPSLIEVHQVKNTVFVKFTETHVGHSNDLLRLNLTQKEKDLIAKQLAMKVSVEDILNNIRNSLTGEEIHRIHLLTRKDILNIADQYNLNKESSRLNTDSDVAGPSSSVTSSTHFLVEEISDEQKTSINPLSKLKPDGEEEEFSMQKRSLIEFANEVVDKIQNKEQLNFFMQHLIAAEKVLESMAAVGNREFRQRKALLTNEPTKKKICSQRQRFCAKKKNVSVKKRRVKPSQKEITTVGLQMILPTRENADRKEVKPQEIPPITTVHVTPVHSYASKTWQERTETTGLEVVLPTVENTDPKECVYQGTSNISYVKLDHPYASVTSESPRNENGM